MNRPVYWGWVASVILLFSSPGLMADAAKGEEYFNDANGGFCKSCHFTDSRKLVGPGLQGVTQRHSESWLKGFLADPQATWASDHPETRELKERVHKVRVPKTLCRKNPMSEAQLQNLYDYLNSLNE